MYSEGFWYWAAMRDLLTSSGLVSPASRTAMAAANTPTVITNAAKNAACTMSL